MPVFVSRFDLPPGSTESQMTACLARIAAKLQENPFGCLVWQGWRNRLGYGATTFRSQPWMVHRLIWVLCYGAIPKDKFVCHRCDTPECCRPDHLFLADHTENQRDMIAKGRHAKGRKTHCLRGHPLSGDNLLVVSGHRQCKACNRRRLRLAAGWTIEQAETMPVTSPGLRPVNANFKRARSNVGEDRWVT